MLYQYKSVEKGNGGKKMDGGNPLSFANTLYRPPLNSSETERFFKLALGYSSMQNNSGGSASMGIGARINKLRWKAGQWVNSTTTYTDDTVDAQDTDTNDFALETLVANDGFIVGALDVFNVIDLDITTASTGTGVTRTLEYSLAGGTWAAMANSIVAPVTGGHWVAAETLIWWVSPFDWAVMEAGHGTGIPIGYYGVRIRATTPPGTTAGLAKAMSVAQARLVTQGLGSAVVANAQNLQGETQYECGADSIVGIIASGNTNNQWSFGVRVI